MPPEVAGNIFQPYFTTKEKGTGLGLAICQNIMTEHGGCIFADSPPGRGATFTIQLPLQETSPAAGASARRGKPRIGWRSVAVNHGLGSSNILMAGNARPERMRKIRTAASLTAHCITAHGSRLTEKMTTAPKPIRIAIVLNGQEFICHAVTLPFSLEGYPPVDLVLYGTKPEVAAGCQVNLLPDLDPKAFDLILDGQFMTAGRPAFSPEPVDNLITGPVARFLNGLVCQLQELRQKQEINSGIINSATDAIVTINEDHVIVGYNLGAEQMFGYTRGEALGQDLTIIIPPPYKAEHRDYVRRYMATREARMIGKHARLSAQRRDGREFPISISFSVAEIRDNLYFTGIIRDITEYKELEDRVLHTERLAAVGNTMTHIAHEIKNPLLIIGGFARQLIKVPGLDDKSRRKLSIMAEEVSQLEEMVAEMREFVRRPPAQKRPGQMSAALDRRPGTVPGYL